MVDFLREWKGEMIEDSVAATIYSYWQILFFRTLFVEYEKDPMTRMTLSGNYPFTDFYNRLIRIIADGPSE